MNPVRKANKFPIRLLATTPQVDVPLRAAQSAAHLPAGPHGEDEESNLRYGPYLKAVRHLLVKDNCQKILKAVCSQLNQTVTAEEVEFIEIRTEKHGAWYHVARVDVSVTGQKVLFAVNVAAAPEVRQRLEKEYRLLDRLNSRYHYGLLPNVYFKGAGRYRARSEPIRWLHMFVAEWFKGFHEFHLHRDDAAGPNRMLLWDLDRGSRYLSERQCLELYRQAAKTLTLYYDWNSSKQIYPWHHAAGDFVLKEEGEELDVRLVTVRNYYAVVDFGTGNKTARTLALILFFLHLTVRMRVDRLDGVGEVVWAEDYCLEGVVAGFFEGLVAGEKRDRRGVVSAKEIKKVLRSFSRDEWLQLLVELLETYQFSHEELSLLSEHGDRHIDSMRQVLRA